MGKEFEGTDGNIQGTSSVVRGLGEVRSLCYATQGDLKGTDNLEIERKWLIDKPVPEDLRLDKYYEAYQGYLSVNPEVRVRMSVFNGDIRKFRLTIKGEGDLTRKEIQFYITEREFNDLLEIGNIKDRLMFKKCDVYEYGKHFIELSRVDNGELDYLEVEFNSEKDAKEFEVPDWFGEEVTNDERYKMKNYWNSKS